MREVLSRIWSRATATQPAPEPAVVAAVALVALALVVLPRAWSLTRHLVTISHEGGHALVAVLTPAFAQDFDPAATIRIGGAASG